MPMKNDAKKSNEEKYIEGKAEIFCLQIPTDMGIINKTHYEKVQGFIQDFIRTIINDCKLNIKARETRYPDTEEEEKWTRIK